MTIQKLFNLAKVSSTTTGTGDVTLGSAKTGFLSFADAGVSDGDVVSYGIKDGSNFEVGRGTYSSTGPKLARTTVLKSSNSNAALDLSGSDVEVFISPLAEDFDVTGNLAGGFWTSTDVAAAATCDIGAATTPLVKIAGTTTITSFGTKANRLRRVHFNGALTLTHNDTSLILPGSANITTAAGDEAEFVSDSSGNWRCTKYPIHWISINYEDLTDLPTLGTAAAEDVGAFATAAQGALADSAVQPDDLVTVAPSAPQGRLTLTTGVAVTTTDVAGATSIYYTPVAGLYVPLYDGTTTKMVSIGAELSLALDGDSGHTGYQQSGKNFDLFIFNDAGTVRLGTGPAWSGDDERGTGTGTTELELKNGFFTNKQSITARFGASSGDTVSVSANQALYIGSFYATADGQASDTEAKRLVFNTYNSVRRPTWVELTVNTFTYSTHAWQQMNADTANQFQVLLGLEGVPVEAENNVFVMTNTTTLAASGIGIGIDSTTVNSAQLADNTSLQINNNALPLHAKYFGYPGIGLHSITSMQYASSANTQTWFGTNNGAQMFSCGLRGSVYA